MNDGSADRTSEIASKYPVTLSNLQENLGKANALNIGIKMAKGSIIIFSDSDSQMASNAVRSLISCLRDQPDVHVVAGNVLIDQDTAKIAS